MVIQETKQEVTKVVSLRKQEGHDGPGSLT